jgi:O-acetyl-ADP-ribose deacetylase (regulator of RNase III)
MPPSAHVRMSLPSLGEDDAEAPALPALQQVVSMPIAELVSTVRATIDSPEAGAAALAAACSARLCLLVQRPGADEDAARAGVLAAIVAAMNAHRTVAVWASGCEVVALVCLGAQDPDADEEVKARLALAVEAGGVAAVVAALLAHADDDAALLQRGMMALSVLVGRNASLRARATAAGARADWLATASLLAGGGALADDVEDEEEGAGAGAPSAHAATHANGVGAPANGAAANGRAGSGTLDALIDAALCSVCEDSGEMGEPSLVAPTPRAWLGDLLIMTAAPLSEATLAAVDRVYAAERVAGAGGPARPPTVVGLPGALWLPRIGSTRLCVWRGDMTELGVDAVVNAANEHGLGCFQPSHVCIDNVLHRAAGPQLRSECRKLMAERVGGRLSPGEAPLVTAGYALHARHVLHVTGPTISPPRRAPSADERATLRRCYTHCLEAAANAQLTSVAFCCLSAGLFGYPHKAAAEAAVDAVRAWLEAQPHTSIECVVFDVFTDEDARAYADATALVRQADDWQAGVEVRVH